MPIDNTFLQDDNVNSLLPPTNKDLTKSPFFQTGYNYGSTFQDTPEFLGIGDKYSSKFDNGTPAGALDNLSEIRGLDQHWYEKVGAGLLKGTGLAATTFATTFTSLPYGIIQAIAEGDFSKVYDNDISRKFDEFNKAMEDYLPNYYTNEELNAGAFNLKHNIFTWNFLSDKILKNAGYIVGAIGGGWVGSGALFKAFSAAGKLMASARGAELTGNALKYEAAYLAQGMNKAQALEKALDITAKQSSIVNAATKAGSALLSAGTEATSEALQTKQSSQQAYMDELNQQVKEGKVKTRAQVINDFEIAHPEYYTFNRSGVGDREKWEKQITPQGQEALSKELQVWEPNLYENKLKDVDKYSSSAGNWDYLLNLPLLAGSDLIQFSKYLSGHKTLQKTAIQDMGKATQEVAERITKEGSNYVLNDATKLSKVMAKVKAWTPGLITESNEENMQNIFQASTQDYYDKKFNKNGKADFADLVEATKYGIDQSFGTKNGQESMLLGGLTGVISGTVTGEIRRSLKEIDEKNELGKKFVDILNSQGKDIFNKNSDKIDNGVRFLTLQKEMDEAIKNNDIYTYKNLKNDSFKSFVLSRVKTGKFEQLMDDIDDFKSLPKEEFQQYFGIDPAVDSKQPMQYIEMMKQEATKLNDLYNNLQILHPEASQETLEVMYGEASKLQNLGRRNDELLSTISKSPEIHAAMQNFLENSNDENSKILEKTIKDNNHIFTQTGENGTQLVSDYLRLAMDRRNAIKTLDLYSTPEGVKRLNKITEEKKRINDNEFTGNLNKVLVQLKGEVKDARVKAQAEKLNEVIPNQEVISNPVDIDEYNALNANDEFASQPKSKQENISTNVTSELETKKADIEKRRNEESDNIVEKIVNRGEENKRSGPITEEDKKPLPKDHFDNLFSKISNVLNGNEKIENERANKLLKQYLKETHPDKFQDENKKEIAGIFSTAMINVARKGDITKLNELYNQYKEINAKYDAELAKLESAESNTQPEVKIATDVNPGARKQLNTMGYKDSDVDNLSRQDREVILKNGISKEDWNVISQNRQEVISETVTKVVADPLNLDSDKEKEISEEFANTNKTLQDNNGAKEINDNGTISYTNTKIDNPSNALAHRDRQYKREVREVNGKTRVVYTDETNELDKDAALDLMNPYKFNVGDNISFEVADDGEIQIYDPDTEGKELISWGAYKQRLIDTHPNEDVTKLQEYIDNVPIRVTGQNVFLHNDSWINPENTIADLQRSKLQLRNIRTGIINNKGKYKTKIEDVSNGVLFLLSNNESHSAKDAVGEDSRYTIAVATRTEFKTGKNDVFKEEVVNQHVIPGATYLIVKTANGKNLGIVLNSPRIETMDERDEIKQSILEAINAHLDGNEEVAKNIEDITKKNVLTSQGLSDFLNMFLYRYDTRGSMLRDIIDSIPHATNNTYFTMNNGVIEFFDGNLDRKGGRPYSISKEHQELRGLVMDRLERTLDGLYLNTNIEEFADNKNIAIFDGEKFNSRPYKEFVMNNLTTKVKGNKVGERNSKPVYSYTLNPVVRADFSEFNEESKKLQEETKEVKEPKIKEVKTTKSELSQDSLDLINAFDSWSDLPYVPSDKPSDTFDKDIIDSNKKC